MKRVSLCFLSLALLGSCGQDDDVAPQPVEINRQDIGIADGFQYTFQYFDIDQFPVPQGGENQTWDFSKLPLDGPGKRPGTTYFAVSNPDVPTANIGFASGLSLFFEDFVIPHTALRKLDDTGYFDLGRMQTVDTAIAIFGGAGTLRFPPQNQLYDAPNPVAFFPMTFGEERQSNYNLHIDYLVTYPAAGLNNTPASQVDSCSSSLEVIGWGELLLPGHSKSFRVLLLERTETRSFNFFLGGAPAPKPLLDALGLVDGREETVRELEFYAPQYGRIAAFLSVDGEKYWAIYRDDLPK
jgi:hypothetical protein